jgi:hypothetical protein
MSIVARKFNASPARLSSATWKAITAVVCKDDADATKEFQKVAGVASSLINDRHFKDCPMIVKNEGPRLRVYCLYGEGATTGEDSNENGLSWQPTAKQWHAFLPCSADELKEMATALKEKSIKFSVYDVEKGIPDDTEEDKTEKSSSAQGVSVDWQAFKGL